jgi:hypothetical protein
MGNLVTVPLTIWTDEVLLRAAGASPAGVEQALLNTFREFCTESGAWLVEMWDKHTDDTPKPFNDGADVAFYDLQAKLETIRAASGPYVTGNPAASLTQFHVIDDYYAWDISYVHVLSYFESYVWDPNPDLATQKATHFIQPEQTPGGRNSHSTARGWPKNFRTYNERPGALQLVPTLRGDQVAKEGFVPWVSLTFPRTYVADSVPVVFERYWYEIILDGVLTKLMSQQDKPYTNPVLARYHGARFRNGISQARDMAQRQFSNSERGWVYPAWA